LAARFLVDFLAVFLAARRFFAMTLAPSLSSARVTFWSEPQGR
jgi:hypothetical protein